VTGGTLGLSGITTNAGDRVVGPGALDLSAERDYIAIPPQTFSSGSPYSIAFWARKNGLGWNMVIGQRLDNRFFIALHNTIGLRRRSSSNSAERQSDFATPHDGQWHHYAITATAAGSLSCYLDGEFFGAEANELTGFIYDTIGEAFPDSSNFDFHGQIDDVRIYDDALPGTEVRELYLMGSPLFHYPFDVDFSDHASTNHGVLVDVDLQGNSGITTNSAVGAGALEIGADRDYIAIPSHTFSSGTPYSLAFWAKKAPGDTSDAALWDMVLGQRDSTTFFVGLNATPGIRWRSASSSADRQADFTATDDTDWHHYALVAGADGTLQYYLDGLWAGSANNKLTGFIVDTIGEAYSSTRDFDFHGQIDEVYIYDRSVTARLVRELFEQRDGMPAEYDVYLIAGQSNADGRGLTSELTGSLATWKTPQPDVRIYYVGPYNNDPVNPTYHTGWTILQPGLAAAPSFSGPLPSPYFGLEISLARSLAERSPDRRIALIKVTRGGTSMGTDWHPTEPGNFMWQAFTNFVPKALQTLGNAQDTVRLKGMIWHQGEADLGNLDFAADLSLFLAETRVLVGEPALPIALGELEQHLSSPDVDRSYPNQEMATLSNSDPFTGLASSAGLLTRDGVHFDTPGVIVFGTRYADLIRDIDSDGLPDDWERAMLGSITHSSGTTTEDFDGDGSSDLAEWFAGTHPALASDVLRLIPGALTERALRWTSASGRVYRILSRPDWNTAWTALRENINATPPENSETLPPSPRVLDLYRIEVVSPGN
jgi:hypothetical protein